MNSLSIRKNQASLLNHPEEAHSQLKVAEENNEYKVAIGNL